MDSVSKYLIYALVDPRTQQWRYIGKSSHGIKRASIHAYPSDLKKSGNSRKANWIKSLFKLGLIYDIETVELISSFEELNTAEREWIAEARRIGMPLTNLTDGGDGQSKGYKHSPEARKKMSEALKGKVPAHNNTPENIKRLNELSKKHASSEHLLELAQRRQLSPIWDSDGVKYETVTEAARKLKLNPQNIRNVIFGKRHLAGKLAFTNKFELVDGLLDRKVKKKAQSIQKGAALRAETPRTRERNKKQSISMGGCPFKDHLGNIYFTLNEAAKVCGGNASSVSKVLHGKISHTKGFNFSYLETP